MTMTTVRVCPFEKDTEPVEMFDQTTTKYTDDKPTSRKYMCPKCGFIAEFKTV